MASTAEKYEKLFLTEADEKIADLNRALLGLEKKPGDFNLASDAMRAAHTLKSSATAMEFMGISHLAHAMEDLFEEMRLKKHRLEPNAVEILFESADMLSSAVKAIKKGQPEPDMKTALERLQKEFNVQEYSRENTKTRKQENNKTRKKESNKSEIVNLKSAPEAFVPIEAIKVDVAVLDKLMNLTEELLVGKMHLADIVRRAEESIAKDLSFADAKFLADKPAGSQASGVNVAELKGRTESFDRLLSDLQFNVTQARMVPLGQVFERFPRMVRDLAKEQKKEVDFIVKGQEIELDRTIIDRLGEPLIHLLRNAVDHGVPAYSDGRKSRGTITLSAERKRDKVFVRVENDGNEINWPRVIEVTSNRGIIDKNTKDKYIRDVEKWKPEIEKLLYLGQVSTKEKVTETSGRGIGLSVVRTFIEALGGTVSIESPIQQTGGTRFTLGLPLTLAIIQALLVRVENQTFALPFSQVDRSVRVPAKNIKKAFDQEVAVVDGEDIPVIRMDKLFGLKKEKEFFLAEKESRLKQQAELMVIARKENFSSVGLMIDEMISEQDIVVKPLKGILKKTMGFEGVTFLEDGRPALILDVTTLI